MEHAYDVCHPLDISGAGREDDVFLLGGQFLTSPAHQLLGAGVDFQHTYDGPLAAAKKTSILFEEMAKFAEETE